MDFFPFYNRPYYYTQNRYVNSPYFTARNRKQSYSSENISKMKQEQDNKSRIKNDTSQKESKYIKKIINVEAPIFEIFGLKLFFDDILIIALIFFLYNEGVRDNLLFISLILILLS